MTSQYPDPESEAATRAAQIAAVSVALVEAIARLREERAALRMSEEDRSAVAMRAARLTDHAVATATWAPALDRRWVAQADTHALLDVWVPAAAWAERDAGAGRALAAVEQRLTATHPTAMSSYRAAVANGSPPAVAMQEAAPAFTHQAAADVGLPPRVPHATPTHKPSRR